MILFIRTVAVFGAAIVMLSARSSGQTRLAVPSYQNPGTFTWQSWSVQGPASVGIMVVNINKGDDEKYYSRVDSGIQDARRKGMYVLGYTYTSYGKRDPKLVHQKIDAAYSNYDLDGIFFDEAPTNCTAPNQYAGTDYRYYHELSTYVRMKHAGAHFTVLNPGTYSANDCWMSAFNILMNWENVGLSNYQAKYVDYPWVHKYPAERFWHVLLGVTQGELQTALDLAKARNAGWVYVSDSPDNAYNQVPVYWAAEASAITKQSVQAPYATVFPDSSDGANGTVKGRVSICWRSVSGSVWQTFIDADQNSGTGYRDSQLSLGAEYMLETSFLGVAKLYRYTGSSLNWSWSEVLTAQAEATFPDQGMNLVSFNVSELIGATRVAYQIRSLDQGYNQLYTSYSIPLDLANTGFIQDILSHVQ